MEHLPDITPLHFNVEIHAERVEFSFECPFLNDVLFKLWPPCSFDPLFFLFPT